MKKIKDDFDKYLEEQLKDEEFRKEYEELELLYALIEEEIKTRIKKGSQSHGSQREM